jgi:hypothetical protein
MLSFMNKKGDLQNDRNELKEAMTNLWDLKQAIDQNLSS